MHASHCQERFLIQESTSVAIEVHVYIYVLVFNPDGIVLVRRLLCYSNSRVQSYIKRGRLLDLHTEVQTVPSDEDVCHVGNAPVRRRWVQLARRPVIMI